MKRIPSVLAIALALFFGQSLLRSEVELSSLANQAVSSDLAEAKTARQALRDLGPAGLAALDRQYSRQILAHRAGDLADPSWPSIAAALNQVSGQYDDASSNLYWYTDLAKAKAASAATGRPILSLRLLGHLDTDLSCANSRLFRTTLYPNTDVSRLLRERFILHWESVRPVPVVTIDFGDGRKLVRTVTGNSIHYILDSEGRIVDALPGLYSASAFVSELTKAADVLASFRVHDPATYADYQAFVAERLREAWISDLNKSGVAVKDATLTLDALSHLTTEETWQSIARLHQKETTFDGPALQLISSKSAFALDPSGALSASIGFPTAQAAATRVTSKTSIERPIVTTLKVLRSNVTADTVHNEYQLRTAILTHLSAPQNRGLSLSANNDWVYTNIFLTPPNDPWLGLAPEGVFAALDHDGKIQAGNTISLSAPRPPTLE